MKWLIPLFFVFFSLPCFASINVETIETTDDVGYEASVALDSNGIVHIAHHDETNSALRYCNNTGGTFICKAIETGGDIGEFTSIAIDSNDDAHIVFYNDTSNLIHYCKVVDGTATCEIISNDVTDKGPLSIAINSTDAPFVGAFNDTNNKMIVWYKNGVSWEFETMPTTFSDIGNGGVDIAINSSNHVFISAEEAATNDWQVCFGIIGSWTCEEPFTYNEGTYSSIAIDSNDIPHISGLSSTANDLVYCNRTSGSWNCETVETGGSCGFGTSIIVDELDRPRILHYETDDDMMRLCTRDSPGTWTCENITNVASVIPTFATFANRQLANKRGRLMDSSSFDGSLHMVTYNQSGGDLLYIEYIIAIPTINSNTTNPATPSYNDTITIIANVTITGSESIVWTNFTLTAPNGTVIINNQNGTNYETDLWNSSSFNTNADGQWNITIQTFSSNDQLTEINMSFIIITIPNITDWQLEASSGYTDTEYSIWVNCTDISNDLSYVKVSYVDPNGANSGNKTMVVRTGNQYEYNVTFNIVGVWLNFTFWCGDTAGNENHTNTTLNFTASARPTTTTIPGGGGGGGPTPGTRFALFNITPLYMTAYEGIPLELFYIVNNTGSDDAVFTPLCYGNETVCNWTNFINKEVPIGMGSTRTLRFDVTIPLSGNYTFELGGDDVINTLEYKIEVVKGFDIIALFAMKYFGVWLGLIIIVTFIIFSAILYLFAGRRAGASLAWATGGTFILTGILYLFF